MKEYKEIFDLIKSNKVKGICFDSREVEEGFLFIAQKGTNVDGHKFINTAISKGAKYIVCEFIP
ncbi:MAG: Mur ligase domain-containing protein, partial [Bacteroidales bacterium]|nr:Mur ligase domain-containing protein [Bacteroidales bacterium]